MKQLDSGLIVANEKEEAERELARVAFGGDGIATMSLMWIDGVLHQKYMVLDHTFKMSEQWRPIPMKITKPDLSSDQSR